MKKWIPLFVSLFLVLTSCVSELDKYYETPDWLKGNSWEVLEQKGNFTMFLSAVQRSSFKDLVQGKGIITVMAPTDSAFQVYLKKHNYNSVNDITGKELDKLVGYHLMYYSFNKEALEDYRPNGSESTNPLKGMYYKFRTKSRDSISTETDPGSGKKIKVMHFDRFLPVFSYNFFSGLGIDAKSNYEFLYPSSTWTGANGFNVSNASVKEYAIVSDNGYVYTINQVLEPLETIYSNLKSNADFSTFLSAYERFAEYTYDATSSTDYGDGDSLFLKDYSQVLPSISSEWPVSSYLALSTLSYGAHNVFAPDNNALQTFFNTYWKPYYSDISKVNFEPLLALLQNHVYSSTVLFPSQIESGLLLSNYGTAIQFNRSEAETKNICVNGSLYGLNKIITPPMFTKVTKPMYCDTAYNLMLNIVKNGGYIPTLITNTTTYRVFYPNNSTILNYSNLDGKMMTYSNSNPKKYGYEIIKIESESEPVAMSVSQKKKFAAAHIATECISTRGTDEAVYRTMLSYNYLYVKGNKVYSSYLYNLGVDAKVPTFSKIEDYDNGQAYALSGSTACALTPEYNYYKYLSTTTIPTDLKTFYAYCSLAGFTTTTPAYSFTAGEQFILLVPPATSIASYYTSLTGTATEKKDKLAAYLKSCFISVSSSGLLDYPFPGANVKGTLISYGKKSNGANATFTLSDDGTNVIITDAKGTQAKATCYFPRIYGDCAVYTTDKLLSVE